MEANLSANVPADPQKTPIVKQDFLPPIDACRLTKTACHAGIITSWIVGLAAVAASARIKLSENPRIAITPLYYYYDWPKPTVIYYEWYVTFDLGTAWRIVIGILVNVIVSACTDSLGFIHATSLRWALYDEGRLEYRTNVRLLTRSRKSWLNGAIINTISAIALVVAYVTASQVIVQGPLNNCSPDCADQQIDKLNTAVSGIALLGLGLSILLLAAISTVCVIRSRYRSTYSWSPNLFQVTLACCHGSLERRQGRCMLSVKDRSNPSCPTIANSRQPSMWSVDRSVRHVLRLSWAISILVAVLGGFMLLAKSRIPLLRKMDWMPSYLTSSGFFKPMSKIHLDRVPEQQRETFDLFIVCAFQAPLTLGLHCLELIMDRMRDELSWKEATKRSKGARTEDNPLIDITKSWPNILLFLAKPLAHWLFGTGLAHSGYYDFVINTNAAFTLAGVLALLAIISTAIVFWQPRSPQPVAWGHIQTLADLVDDWTTDDQGRFWWGDKGSNADGTRHAGMLSSPEKLGEVITERLYG